MGLGFLGRLRRSAPSVSRLLKARSDVTKLLRLPLWSRHPTFLLMRAERNVAALFECFLAA